MDSGFLNKEEIDVCARDTELLALFEIGKAVNSTLDLDKVLDVIVRETLKLFSAEAGSIMLMDDDGYLTIKAARGLSREIIEKTKVKPGEGISGWVYETGEVLLLDGKVTDNKFTKLVDRKEEILSSLAVPLKSRGKKLGVLTVRRTSSSRYTEHDRNLIKLIADQAAIAIENASLFEQQRQRSRQLQLLNEELAREKLKIETILANMADGVMVVEPEGYVALVNNAGCKLLEMSRDKLTGTHFDTLFPGQCEFEDIRDAIFNKKIRYKKEISTVRDDEDYHFRIIATGMKLDEKHLEGVVVVIQNITEMKRIDKMKTEFVSMVSHELRTPLTSIHGFSELMLMRDFDKERRSRYLNIILKDTTRLMRLIDNLLDLAKLESGKITYNLEPLNLDQLIPKILESFEVQVTRHVVNYEVEGEIPVVMLDKDMLTNVINNLVSNAIKYSPGGGEINIRLKRLNDCLRVEVEDSGVGLPPEMKDKIFDKFFRVDSSLTRETGGTGLGLATVKYIVEGFGGKIWVESELGKGSNFIFTIPLEV